MLRAAAELTLELALSALMEGFALKDATPYNLMFEGPRPVFLDFFCSPAAIRWTLSGSPTRNSFRPSFIRCWPTATSRFAWTSRFHHTVTASTGTTSPSVFVVAALAAALPAGGDITRPPVRVRG